MFAKERQDDIVEQVNQSGSVKVKDLSLKYQVTEDCIRKDLAVLEKKGKIKKDIWWSHEYSYESSFV